MGTDIPCDVVTLLVTYCVSCHGSPTAGGAPVTLLTQPQFAASSMADPTKTSAQRSLLRMQQGTMPPGGGVPQAMIDSFSAWVTAGLTGSCSQGVDAGVIEPTCASTLFQPVPSEANASERMAPGLACIACHQGQNFQGQNPGGLSAPNEPPDPPRILQFMGTVFAAQHEQNLCRTSPSVTSASVEIYDANGTKVLTMAVNDVGNFMGDVPTGMPIPYTAKVVTSSGSRTMSGRQTSGDCNTCHTAIGEQGAPGRIYLP